MKKITLLLASACLFLFAACKQNGPNTGEKTAVDLPTKTGTERAVEILNSEVAKLDNPWKTKTGDLLTDDDFTKTFGAAGLKSLNRIARENYCLYEWLKPDWVQRDNANDKSGDKFTNPKNNVVFLLIDFGQPKTAAAIFQQKLDLRTEHWNDKVAGIGEGALWSNDNRRLIVLVGQFIINIDVSVEDEAVANLPKAKEVAAIVVPKLAKKG